MNSGGRFLPAETGLTIGCVAVVLAVAGWPSDSAAEAIPAAEVRERFVLSEKPPAALTLGDALGILKKATDHEALITVSGTIAAKDPKDSPFLEGKASFMLIDLADDGHAKAEGHDADSCPFCKRRKEKATVAAVQFVDDAGAVIPSDARAIFGIDAGQKVVIRGRGRYDPDLPFPIVQITAEGIYVVPR